MGKRVRRLSVFLLVAVAALSVQVGLLCRVCKASEPSEEVVARIKKFFSIIDDDGKEFLFPEDAANLDLSDITVGNGYKRYRLEGERLEDSNLVNYPIFSGGRPFAICITKYNDSGVEEVVQAGSIRSEPIVVEMRKRRSFYLISGPYIWHYEGGALVSKGETGRVGHEDSREEVLALLASQGAEIRPDTLTERLHEFARACYFELTEEDCGSCI